MLSIAKMTAGAAVSYHIHLQKDGQVEDYYASEGKGQWLGDGAKQLGLSGEVHGQDFTQLAQGYHPETGAAMVQNAGHAERVAGFDLTFSAPKSVSIAKAVSSETEAQKIQAAHDRAVEKALTFMQDKAAWTRTGHGGESQQKAELVIARFNHQTSREQDPQLHTHSFVFNLTQRADGTSGTLDGKHLYDWKMAAGAAYRAELADNLKALGYQMERDGDSFRITGISKDADREFSTRRQQIEDALKTAGQGGAKASEIAALASRKPKEIKDPAQLQQMWREQAQGLGVKESELKTDRYKTPDLETAAPDKAVIADKMTEHKSVIREQDIYKAAFTEAQGTLSADHAKALAEQVKAEAVHLQKAGSEEIRYTTQTMLDREAHIVAMAGAREYQQNALKQESITQSLASNTVRLSAEQETAARELTLDGGVKVLIGDAGTGKSTTLEAVRTAYQSEGWQVLGAAPTGKAAAGLQEGAGIESVTIHKLQADLDKGKIQLDARTVLIVDEAGMVGSRQMEALMQKVEENGAKLILVGDHKQLQSVEAGAAFRDIAREVGASRISEIHRQRDDDHKTAVSQIAKGDVEKAMHFYIEKNAIHLEKNYRDAIRTVADKAIANLDKEQSSIALASTNKQVKDINHEIRAQLKSRGELQQHANYQTTKGKLEIAQDDRLLLTRNEHQADFKNGDLATVIKLEKDRIEIRLDRTGEIRTLDTKEYQHIEHGYAITTHKAQGMSVENAVVYASKDASRELAYVQASRAKDSTEFVFTKDTVHKLAEQTQPTAQMASFAKSIEAHRLTRGESPALPEQYETSFRACREYLNQHAYGMQERENSKNESLLHELKDTLKAMSASRQNESTRDYQIVQKQPELQQEASNRHTQQEKSSQDREKSTDKAPDKSQEANKGADGGRER